MRKLLVTIRDIQRYKVLTEVIVNRLTVREASEILSLSYRHTLRLKDKFKIEGSDRLLRKNPLLKTAIHGGLHYNVKQEHEDTQIERALEELGITLISANSPQAKGRIEVTFRLFQDRLIKEMRLAGIKGYDEGNEFLIERFIPWYNTKYTREAESVYMPLPKYKKPGCNLLYQNTEDGHR